LISFEETKINRKIDFNYLDEYKICLESFNNAMNIYLENGLGEEFSYYVQQTHKMESQADYIRKKIEWEMYSKALLPESRGDLLGFLETMDKIPNKAESVLYQIQLQRLSLPKELKHNIKELLLYLMNQSSLSIMQQQVLLVGRGKFTRFLMKLILKKANVIM